MAPLAEPRAQPTAGGVNADTATRILDATLAAMADHGIARLSLEDVAKRAGLSRQTVYRYFPSKGALLEATVLREEQTFIANMIKAAARHKDLEPALRAAVEAALRTGRDHVLLNRLLVTEPNSLVALLTTDRGPVLSAARQALEEILPGWLPKVPKARLGMAADAVARLLVSYVINPPADQPAQVATRLAQLLVHGLPGAGS
ncbi:MAG TPA: TetR family transcriptional regulator [Acidimicrobiia bacterium]|nr:TetR family transcriptional regulator [Acidimicrobiia bacterium]